MFDYQSDEGVRLECTIKPWFYPEQSGQVVVQNFSNRAPAKYLLSFQIWIVKLIFLTFAMAKDDRRERHRSLLHFP